MFELERKRAANKEKALPAKDGQLCQGVLGADGRGLVWTGWLGRVSLVRLEHEKRGRGGVQTSRPGPGQGE